MLQFPSVEMTLLGRRRDGDLAQSIQDGDDQDNLNSSRAAGPTSQNQSRSILMTKSFSAPTHYARGALTSLPYRRMYFSQIQGRSAACSSAPSIKLIEQNTTS